MKALCLIFPDGYGAFFFICQRHTQSQRLFVHLLHHTQMQHPMKVKIEESWRQRLQEEFDQPYFERLVSFVKSEYGRAHVLPPGPLIFHVFNSCPFEKVKVVILGQDPYPTPGQYYGICFSVPEGVAIPGSLVNIFREIHQDLGKPIPTSGNLDRWVAQGVFSMNSVLMVRAHETGSHRNMGWETFTDAVIKKLSDALGSIRQRKSSPDRQKQAPHTDNRPSFAPFCRIRLLRMQAFQQSQQLSAEQRH